MKTYQLSYELALIVDDCLKSKGVIRGKKLYDTDFCTFDEIDLLKITSLLIEGTHSLEGIEFLSNLSSLEIASGKIDSLALDIPLEQNNAINYITDFSPITKLHKLTRLTITNDINIKSLDLTNFPHLKSLTLVNNIYLKELIGLDELKELKAVTEYGNQIMTPLNIKKYVKNTKQAFINLMDITRYSSFVENEKDAVNATRLLRTQQNNLQFAEKTAIYNCYLQLPFDVQKIYQTHLPFISKIDPNISEEEKIAKIYEYVVFHNQFDYEGLKDRFDLLKNANLEYQYVPFEQQKKFIWLHTSAAASFTKKSNCEGYVNYMRLLLSMLHIPSVNVYCSIKGKEPERGMVNHSIIKVEVNGCWYYFDPSLEISSTDKEFKWAFLTKEEIDKTHHLGALEQQNNNVESRDNNGNTNGYNFRKCKRL